MVLLDFCVYKAQDATKGLCMECIQNSGCEIFKGCEISSAESKGFEIISRGVNFFEEN